LFFPFSFLFLSFFLFLSYSFPFPVLSFQFPFLFLAFSFCFPFLINPFPFFSLFLSFSSPFRIPFPSNSFILPFPFPCPRSCESFGQGVKPALGKPIRGEKNDNMWKKQKTFERARVFHKTPSGILPRTIENSVMMVMNIQYAEVPFLSIHIPTFADYTQINSCPYHIRSPFCLVKGLSPPWTT
jgi:hypothetical protein